MKSVKEMTLKEKIGQLVFVGFTGLDVTDSLKTLIKDYKLGNIILFTKNINNLEQLHNLNQSIYQEVMNETGVIPFISIDQEGGMVTRIMKEATFCPGNMTIAATNSDNAYKVGQISGEELRALGINMNLAPSMDVNNNPLNPVIGVRSYSDNPDVVSEYGIKYIHGLQEKGIIATAKHFPGHGDTSSDSHYSLPIIPHDKQRLNDIELYPFKKAIAANVDAIMSAHVFFTAYEEDNLPGTLSKKVLTDLLRNELGFKGLIVSDCMEMKAIDETYTASKGSLMGLIAGLDMVFISHTFSKQVDAFKLIEEAVLEGSFPMELLDEKVDRILRYKEKIFPIIEEFFFNKTYQEKYDLITNKESKDLSLSIVNSSLTKVKGKDFYPNKRTLVIAPEPFATTIAEDEVSSRSIIDAIKAEKLEVDTVKIKVKLTDEEINEISDKARFYQNVVVCTYNASFFKTQAKLVNVLDKVVEDLYVLSTRNPYDYLYFKQVKNYLCLYEYTPNSVKTVVKYLKREIIPTGKLPINLNEKVKVGASIYVGLKEYSLKDNLEYLNKLKDYKIDSVFISAHMPEMKKGFEEELNQLISVANKLEIKVILDVSKPMMDKFEIPNIYSLRLDYGFNNDEILDLYNQKKFIIELNASTVTKEQLDYLVSKGMNLSEVRISHNFYPKLYTGLSQLEVERRNRIFKDYGLKVMAYIPSSNQKRPPLYEGLPTVEEHRFMNLDATLSELRLMGVDEVFFGDAYASQEELQKLVNFDFDTINIPIVIRKNLSKEEKNQLLLNHRNRIDESIYFKRSSTRLKEGKIAANNCIARNYLDLTIDNEKFGRYQGEVSIIVKDLPSDERVNVVGKAVISDYLLNKITPGTKFKFKVIGEE